MIHARIAATALVSLIAACGREDEAVPDIRPVRTLTVSTDALRDKATYTGDIRSRYEADLGFRLAGKVIERPVDVGAPVKKGDVLARIDAGDQRLGVESARSGVAAARAQLEQAKSDEARLRDLLEKGLTSRSAYAAQQTAVKTAESQVRQAQADLNLREQQVSYTTLRADKAGVITKVYAEVGAVLGAGQPVVTLAQPSELEVVFDVAESQVALVKPGLSVQIALLSARNKPFAGKVREVSPSADPTTRTYRVRTAIPYPPAGLELGMTAVVMIETHQDEYGLAIPATALHEKDREPAVWVVGKDDTVELRPVTVARYDSDMVWLTGGLAGGDRIVTAGVHKLMPGQKVRVPQAKP
jgi:RND family efflux transporter MFP subunit